MASLAGTATNRLWSVTLQPCATRKVQLLLREDGPNWSTVIPPLLKPHGICKLAQTIVSLFFGWENGNDTDGRKRVTIISGGLTGRVRRKYRLNSVLNPCPPDEDPFLWEEKCKRIAMMIVTMLLTR